LSCQREDQIKALVRRSYEDPRVIARYISIGLWPSEENLVIEYVPDEARILDMGCGAGRTTIPLAEMGLDIVGIDISSPMIQFARQQANLAGVHADFQVMDSMQLEFPDASFEVVLYSYNGIELIPGRAGKKKVMAEVLRVLKPGGCFIFSSHSLFALNRFALFRLLSFFKLCAGRFAGLPVRERELGERFADGEDEEVRYLQVLPPFSLLKMLRQTGFDVIYFNTRKRLENGSKWGFLGHFEDGERFYVARKI
jgi:SAM-dependent methyltransferase